MRKGKLGVVLCLYPVIAFAAVILDSPLLCALLVLFTLAAERDEWAVRQCLQALTLSAAVRLIVGILSGLTSFLSIPILGSFLSVVGTVLCALVKIAAWVLSILAIVRVLGDREADLPLFSALSYRVYGKRAPKPAYPPAPGTPGAAPTAPMGNAAPTAPAASEQKGDGQQ